jgi:hypothetical protein
VNDDHRIEQDEIDLDGDLLAFDEANEALRIKGRTPASLPSGYQSWEEWWPTPIRPPWVKNGESIPSHPVDRLPNPVNAMWQLFVAATHVAHDYDQYFDHDPLKVLPVARTVVTVRQCQAPGRENVMHILSSSEPTLREWSRLSSPRRRPATALTRNARSGGHLSARPSIVVARFLSQSFLLWVESPSLPRPSGRR